MIVKKFMCLVHHCPASQNCDLRRSKEEAGVWVRWHPGFEVLKLFGSGGFRVCWLGVA